MYELPKVTEEALQQLKYYPGMLGVLVYSPLQKVFEGKVRDAYHELHIVSDGTLMVLAGRSDWLSDHDRQKMMSDVHSRLGGRGDRIINMMVSMPSANRWSAAEDMATLQKRYGIDHKELPCILLLPDLMETNGYVFPIDRDTIDDRKDALASDLVEFFSVCSKAMEEKACPVKPLGLDTPPDDYAKLVEWREETLDRIVPSLNMIRAFRAARKLAPPLVGGVLRGVAGLVS